MFRPAQGARDREEDGRVLYLPPPPRSRGGSVSPGGSRTRGEGGRRVKRLIVACDGMPTILFFLQTFKSSESSPFRFQASGALNGPPMLIPHRRDMAQQRRRAPKWRTRHPKQRDSHLPSHQAALVGRHRANCLLPLWCWVSRWRV